MMKVLFYVKSIADAHLAHALAQIMRDRIGATAFAATVYRDSGEGYYFRQYASDLFSHILSESEMYRCASRDSWIVDEESLARIEKEYGIPTIWQYVTHDRQLIMRRNGYLFKYGTNYTRNQLLAHILTRFLMIESFFDDFEPDIVVYAGTDVGPSSALILSRVASARGIPILVPMHSRIGSYYAVTDTVFNEMRGLEERYRELRSGLTSPNRQMAAAMLAQIAGGKLWPSFGPRRGPIDKQLGLQPIWRRPFKALKGVSAKALDYRRKIHSRDPLYVSLLKRQYDAAVMWFRRSLIRRSKYFSSPKENEKYVFFPLQIEPELSLLLHAPFHTGQLAIIRNIAQSLPYDTCLYVKDHIAAIGYRSLSSYKQMAMIPNVRLIPPFVNSYRLIKHSKGVVTITGTAGMEAMLLGKPVITLGNVFYNFASELVWHTNSFEEIPLLIKQFDSFRSDESLRLDFLTALLDVSIDVGLHALAGALVSESSRPASENADLLRYAEFLMQRIGSLRVQAA
jgi:hypothetical protein